MLMSKRTSSKEKEIQNRKKEETHRKDQIKLKVCIRTETTLKLNVFIAELGHIAKECRKKKYHEHLSKKK